MSSLCFFFLIHCDVQEGVGPFDPNATDTEDDEEGQSDESSNEPTSVASEESETERRAKQARSAPDVRRFAMARTEAQQREILNSERDLHDRHLTNWVMRNEVYLPGE